MDATHALDLLNRGVFVGRKAERQRLASCLEDAGRGRPKLVLIGGEPGVGKTSLVRDLLEQAPEDWWRCCVSCAEPSLEPYGPLPEILRRVTGGELEEAMGNLPGASRDAIARFAFARRDEGTDDARLVDADDYPHLRDGAVRVLHGVIERAPHTPLLICIENLHAAQAPAIRLLRDVVTALASARIVIVATLRNDELGPAHPVHSLATLPADVLVKIELAGLSTEEARTLFETIAEHKVPKQFARRLQIASGGNPFLLCETLRDLIQRNVLEHDGVRWICRMAPEVITLPDSIRSILDQRLVGLDVVRRMLETASLFPTSFALTRVGELAGIAAEELTPARKVAVRMNLLVQTGAPNCFAFRHGLFRQALHDGLDVARRSELHRAIAHTLESGPRVTDAQVLEIAHHHREAAAVGSATQAVVSMLDAAALEERRRNFDAAATHYATALQMAHREGCLPETERFDAAVRMLEALGKTGRVDELRVAVRKVAPTARRLGADALARVALAGGGHMRGFGRFRYDGDLVALVEEAIVAHRAAAGEPDVLILLLARLAGELMMGGRADAERGRRAMEEALDGALACEDTRLMARVLRELRFAPRSDDDLARRFELVRERAAVGTGVEDEELRLEIETERALGFLERADGLGAKRIVDAVRHLAERRPYHRWVLACLETCIAGLDGRLDDVELLGDRAHRLGVDADVETAGVLFTGSFGPVQWLRGKLDDLAVGLQLLPTVHPHAFPVFDVIIRAGLASTLAEAGRLAEARVHLDQLSDGELREIPRNALWLPTAAFLSLAAHAVGDARYAEALYGQMLPFAGRIVVLPPVSMFGAADLYLGLLATLAKRPRDARRHFEDALLVNRHAGCRAWVARTQVELAAHLIQTEQRSGTRAVAMLRDALELATKLGLARTAERARALLPPDVPEIDGPYYVMKPEGEIWMIGDETGFKPFKDMEGHTFDHYLLERPGRLVRAGTLRAVRFGTAGTPEHLALQDQDNGPCFDAETPSFVRRYFEDLQEAVDNARDEESRRKAEDALEDARQKADEHLHRHSKFGKARIDRDQAERDRQCVAQGLDRAWKSIRKAYPRLEAHLRASVTRGRQCGYRPQPADTPRWVLR